MWMGTHVAPVPCAHYVAPISALPSSLHMSIGKHSCSRRASRLSFTRTSYPRRGRTTPLAASASSARRFNTASASSDNEARMSASRRRSHSSRSWRRCSSVRASASCPASSASARPFQAAKACGRTFFVPPNVYMGKSTALAASRAYRALEHYRLTSASIRQSSFRSRAANASSRISAWCPACVPQ
jgi:hypothetical protein